MFKNKMYFKEPYYMYSGNCNRIAIFAINNQKNIMNYGRIKYRVGFMGGFL